MTERRTTLAIVAVGFLAAFGGTLVAATVLNDPEQSVAPINLSNSSVERLTGESSDRRVPTLDTLSGLVTNNDGDANDLEIERVELDFGPDNWVSGAGPFEDYDRDGQAEKLGEELAGLVGSEATIRARLDIEGDDADVYVINDLPFREVSGPAPWQSAGAVSEDEIRAAAEQAVGPGARVVDLEAEDGRTVAWQAEVVDGSGQEYDVLLDAEGNSLDVRRD